MDTSAADNCEVGRYLEYEDIYLRTTADYVAAAVSLDSSLKAATCASGDKFIADERKKHEMSIRFDADISVNIRLFNVNKRCVSQIKRVRLIFKSSKGPLLRKQMSLRWIEYPLFNGFSRSKTNFSNYVSRMIPNNPRKEA